MNNRIIRKFGFKKDQQGIINRYIRESDGWDKHLKNTKEFILKNAQNKAKNCAVILGSGWLLDVPAKELSDMFKKLTLIDIVHPRQIVHKLNKFNNIEFIESDISGYIEPTYKAMKENKKRGNRIRLTDIKPSHCNFAYQEISTADYIVSVNLLNQLDILICDYIRKVGNYPENEIDAFRINIQATHLELLTNKKSILITDFEELNFDSNEQATNRKQLVFTELPNSNNIEKWTWEFDTSKTYHKDCKTTFKVIAMEL